MQAIEIERSPGLPSLMVTTRRRLMPQGTSFSFLHAVTQALQSMQRSASQRNFIRVMALFPLSRYDLTKRRLRLLHASRWIISIGHDCIHALAEHEGIRTCGVFGAQIRALKPAGKMKRHPCDSLADPFGHDRLHARFRTI